MSTFAKIGVPSVGWVHLLVFWGFSVFELGLGFPMGRLAWAISIYCPWFFYSNTMVGYICVFFSNVAPDVKEICFFGVIKVMSVFNFCSV